MRLAGDVETLPLSDLIQVAAEAKRSCRVQVQGRAHGDLFLIEGEIVHATYGDLSGPDAVYAMLVDTGVRFTVATLGHTPVPRSISMPWRQLLLEGARRLDEGRLRQPTPMAVPIGPPVARPRAWVAGLVVGAGVALLVAALAAQRVVASRWVAREAAAKQKAAASAPARAPAITPIGAARPPRLLTSQTPVVPMADAASAPTIVLEVRVDESGRVIAARPFERRPEQRMFEDAALEAVTRFTFSPGLVDGRPATVWTTVPVAFARSADPVRAARVVVAGVAVTGARLGPALGSAFEAAHPGVSVSWETTGVRRGLDALIAGGADLLSTSRPLTAAELAAVRTAGVTVTELLLGYDELVAVVHPTNPVAAIRSEDLWAVLRGDVRSWDKLQAGAPGSIRAVLPQGEADDFPSIDRFVGESESSRYARGALWYSSPQRVVAAVSRDPRAVGVVSRAFVTAGVRVLPVAAPPAVAGAAASLPPLARALYLYAREPLPRTVARFVVHALAAGKGQAVLAEQGFVPSSGEPPEAVRAAAALETPEPAPSLPAARVSFDVEDDHLSQPSRRALSVLGGTAARDGRGVVVVGHADRREAHGRSLAAARASRVAALFHSVLPRDRVRVRTVGATEPLGTSVTSDGRRKNRRVDVYLE